MKVIVLTRGRDYEGETVLGVYADFKHAITAARIDAFDQGTIDALDDLKSYPAVNPDLPPIWMSSPGSSSTWYTQEWEVQS